MFRALPAHFFLLCVIFCFLLNFVSVLLFLGTFFYKTNTSV